MTPTLRACLLAALIAASISACATLGDDGPPPPCGVVQATWSQAQRDEHAALLDWMRARENKDAAAEAAADKKLKDAWRREMTEGTRSVQRGPLCGPKRP